MPQRLSVIIGVVTPLQNATTIPASSEHLDHLDGWRGLAIVFLLIGHFFPVPGINLGAVGVNLFFVLSGYLMGQLLFIKHTPLPLFYRRRISRIVPAHVFFIVCTTTWLAAAKHPIDWNETLAALFFFNNYFPGTVGPTVMPFGHIWSLSVEEHSYVLLSVLALASRRRWLEARWAVPACALAFSAMGFWYWSHYRGPELEFVKWLHSEVSAYGIFISAALLILFSARGVPAMPMLVYPGLLCVGVMLHWWSVPSPVRTTVGVGILALAINLLPRAPDIVKRTLSFMPLRMMGLWSFSIYLWQQPFYQATHNGGLPRVVAFSLAIGCGVASFYLLERPMRTLLNRVWGRARAAPGSSSESARLRV